MSDAIVFGLLFATYAAMLHSTAGGPEPADLFNIKSAFAETLALQLYLRHGFVVTQIWSATRAAPDLARCHPVPGGDLSRAGGALLPVDVSQRRRPDAQRLPFGVLRPGAIAWPACDFGAIWMLAPIAQMRRYGIDRDVKLGLLRLGLFWYFLDIVWVAIFSIVYLGGLA